MADHEITAHFEVKAATMLEGAQSASNSALAAALMIQDAVTDQMAAAVIGPDYNKADMRGMLAKAKASEVYVMTIALLRGLSEFGIIDFKVSTGK